MNGIVEGFMQFSKIARLLTRFRFSAERVRPIEEAKSKRQEKEQQQGVREIRHPEQGKRRSTSIPSSAVCVGVCVCVLRDYLGMYIHCKARTFSDTDTPRECRPTYT